MQKTYGGAGDLISAVGSYRALPGRTAGAAVPTFIPHLFRSNSEHYSSDVCWTAAARVAMASVIWEAVITAGGARRMWSPVVPSMLP